MGPKLDVDKIKAASRAASNLAQGDNNINVWKFASLYRKTSTLTYDQ